MNTEREGGTEMQQRERQTESERGRKMQHRIENRGNRCSTWAEKTGAAVRECFFFQSVAGRQTVWEWSNSNLVALPVSLGVSRWQALILRSDCLCQQFVRVPFWEFSLLNVWKVTRRIQRDCKHVKQLVFCMLTDRDVPLPIGLVACGLFYRQTGMTLATHARNNLSFSILLDVSCHTEASVLFPWCAVVSWQRFTCWRSVCVCVAQRLTLWADMTFLLRAGGWDGCCELALCRYLVEFFDIAKSTHPESKQTF